MEGISSRVSIFQPEVISTQQANHGLFNHRCIIIINPFAIGCGDISLARKIKEITYLQDFKVEIVRVNITTFINEYENNIPLIDTCEKIIFENDTTLASIAQLTNKVSFIIAPANLLSDTEINNLINLTKDKYRFEAQDPVLINEMGVMMNAKFPMEYYTLGFEEDEIGFLPLNTQTLTAIDATYMHTISNLLDSFCLNFDPNHLYFTAYLSSFINGSINTAESRNPYCIGLFIYNTQIEYAKNEGVSHYIISHTMPLRNQMHQNLNKAFRILGIENSINLYNYDENTIQLVCSYNLNAKNKHVINIYCGAMLPQNIFFNFIKLSTDGMMTGDNSLTEYLSIKESLPFYQMQSFKGEMIESVLYMAKKIGGSALEDYIQSKVIGMNTQGFIADIKILYSELVDKIRQSGSKQQLEKILVAKNAEPILADIIEASLEN